MIILFIIVVLIAFSEIGLAAFLVLPLVGCAFAALLGLLGLLMGAPGSGQLFLLGTGPVVGFFIIAAALDKNS